MKKEEKQQIRAHIAEITQQLVPTVQALIIGGMDICLSNRLINMQI